MSDGKKITLAEASEIGRRSIVDAESRRAEERARDARESACSDCESLRADLARVTAERDRAWASRDSMDCRFAGPLWESSGIHCLPEKPCARCAHDRAMEAAESRAEGLVRVVALADAAIEEGEHQGSCRVWHAPLTECPGSCDCGWSEKVLAYRAAAKSLGERGGE